MYGNYQNLLYSSQISWDFATNIFEIFRKNDYDTLKSVLEEWLNPEDEEETPVESTAKTTGVKSTENIESAFDDLFNE